MDSHWLRLSTYLGRFDRCSWHQLKKKLTSHYRRLPAETTHISSWWIFVLRVAVVVFIYTLFSFIDRIECLVICHFLPKSYGFAMVWNFRKYPDLPMWNRWRTEEFHRVQCLCDMSRTYPKHHQFHQPVMLMAFLDHWWVISSLRSRATQIKL